MCMEDVVISRGTYIKSTASAAGVVTVFTPNPDRIAITLQTHGFGNTRAMLSFGTGEAGNSIGIVVSAAVTGGAAEKIGFVEMTADYKKYPGLLQGTIEASFIGMPGVVLEHLMTPELAKAVRAAENKLYKGIGNAI